jgi:hypothetical protein
MEELELRNHILLGEDSIFVGVSAKRLCKQAPPMTEYTP